MLKMRYNEISTQRQYRANLIPSVFIFAHGGDWQLLAEWIAKVFRLYWFSTVHTLQLDLFCFIETCIPGALYLMDDG